jgi:hypothetical protein
VRITETLVPHRLDTMRRLKVNGRARGIIHHHYWLFHWHDRVGHRRELLVVFQARHGRIVHRSIATHTFVQGRQEVVAVRILIHGGVVQRLLVSDLPPSLLQLIAQNKRRLVDLNSRRLGVPECCGLSHVLTQSQLLRQLLIEHLVVKVIDLVDFTL